MSVLSLVRAFAEGVASGFSLFLTSRNDSIAQVSIPRLDLGSRR